MAVAAAAGTSDAPVEPEMVDVWRLAPLYPRREQRKPRASAPPRRERPADGEKRFHQAAKPRPAQAASGNHGGLSATVRGPTRHVPIAPHGRRSARATVRSIRITRSRRSRP